MDSLKEDQIPVGKAEDLTGKIFGKLTVLYRVKNSGKTKVSKWRCKCSCGNPNYIDVFANNLKRGHTISCGCEQKKKTSQAKTIDEIGNKYGQLTVIAEGELEKTPSGGSRRKWKCQCQCGNVVEVNGTSLRRGLTTSCGCYRDYQISNRSNKKYLGKTFHYITVLKKIESDSKESKWECKCNLCGKHFPLYTGAIPHQISCGSSKDSYGVLLIKKILQNNNIPYETEKSFENCRFPISNRKARFDFWVNNQYLIEYDGQQYFQLIKANWSTEESLKATQNRDDYKNQWCLQNKIPLIRIPYTICDFITIDDLKLETTKYLITNDRYKGGIAEDEEI